MTTRSWRAPGALPLVIGHRGARREAPENTLKAFELAVLQGAAGVELDVRLDQSREVVVVHDRTLGRVTDGRDVRDVEAATTSELRALGIPTLADVLDWASRGRHLINIELKRDVSSRIALVRRVAGLVGASSELRELVLFSSFDPSIVGLISWLRPEFPAAWLVHRKQRIFKYAPGYRALGAIGVNPELAIATDARIQRWKKHGAFLAVWTVNDSSEAKRLARGGVDAIVSDVPGEIVRALAG